MIKFNDILSYFKSSKILKGIIWTFLGTLAAKGFGFLAIFIVARQLSVDDFGSVGVLQSYITTFTLFSLASFGVTATKYIAVTIDVDIKKTSEIFSLIRISSGILAVIVLIASLLFNKQLCFLLTGGGVNSEAMFICSIAVFFASLNGLQIGALTGLESFKSVSIVNIVNGIISFPLIIILTKYFQVKGFAIAVLITSFSIWLCSAILVQSLLKKRKVYFSLKNIKNNLDVIWKFSLPAFISSLLVNPVVLICNSILIKNNKNGLYEMGIFNASNNYSQISLILLGIIGQVFYPYAMKNFGQGNKKFDFVNIVHPLFFGLMICLPTIFLPELFSSLFGSKYHNNDMYLATVIVSGFTVINAQKQGIARNFAAGNFMWFSVISNGFWGLVAIGFSYGLVDMGAIGRGIAFFAAYFLNTVLFIPYFIKNNLVERRLVLSWYNLFYLLIAIGGGTLYFIHISLFFRVLLLLFSILLIIYTMRKWYLSYTNS